MVLASGLLRSTAIDRLLRFQARKFGLSRPPSQRLLKVIVRNRSPCPGRSTLITLAPRSARSWVQNGPCSKWLKSRMVTSESAFSDMDLISVFDLVRRCDRTGFSCLRAPQGARRRVAVDARDMPAAEIGGVERRPVESDIGRMSEEMRGRVLDIDLGLAVALDAQNTRRFVAAAEEIAAFVEGDAVRQPGKIGREGRRLAGASVRHNGDARDPPREGLADIERGARPVERQAVGEDERPVVPEPALAGRQIVRPNARAGRREIVAVRDEQPAPRRIDRRIIGNANSGRRETLHAARGEIKPIDGLVAQIAEEQSLIAQESEAEREAAALRDAFDAGAGRG